MRRRSICWSLCGRACSACTTVTPRVPGSSVSIRGSETSARRSRARGARRRADARHPGRAIRLLRVILYRCFAWNRDARDDAADGPLWFPRIFQGEGRHDNPDVYGCLYLADRAVSCIVEQLAAFRGQRLTPSLLRRRGLPLALAEIELDTAAPLIDLDDPAVLSRERLRPSRVATRDPLGDAASGTCALSPAYGGRRPSVVVELGSDVDEHHVFDRAAPRLRLRCCARTDARGSDAARGS